MTKARIAYVINSVEGGGAALPVPAIARILRAQGAQVRVFALTRRDGRALPAMEQAGLDPIVREGGETDHLAAASWLDEQLRAWGATHVWTSLTRATLLGLLLGPRLGLPVIAWQHAAYLKPWNHRLMRLLQSRASLWVGDSRSVAELTAQRLGVGSDRLTTWPIYSADEQMPRAQAWQAGEPIRVGSLGRLHPVKGYDVLIAALSRMKAHGFTPPAPLQIFVGGEGAERAKLEAMAREAGLDSLSFVGYVEDSRTFLAGLHLYLQPSRSEGFCIAAHEALTAGLPVIASRTGEMRHSITEGCNGYLVAPGDADALASCLMKALIEPDSLGPMGSAAREDVLRRYSQDGFEAAGAAIWQRIVQMHA
ncbi:glycosyltransferase [Croceicoccus estronivorus]|uniref:glycosyltransferase family 4 protein n=1 Tax=Croceicoccus estronivorus TaxID=1172626 RepID=UPI00082FC691|nr:glycosyltransferase [Croceicoccus estronivorus]OCC23411.1 glycosyltransferase [Croceicoccus estronivorus]